MWRRFSVTVQTILILSSPNNFSNTFDIIYKLSFMAGSDEMVTSTVFNRVKYACLIIGIHTLNQLASAVRVCVCMCTEA